METFSISLLPLLAGLSISISTFSASSALASVWSGASASGTNWSDSDNWVLSDVPNNPTSRAQFEAGAAQSKVTVDQNFDISAIDFVDDVVTAPTFTIDGAGTLTLNSADGISNFSSSDQLISTPIELNFSTVEFDNFEVSLTDDRGKLTIDGNVDTGTNELKADAGAQGIAINGSITGTGSLRKVGPGWLDLTADSTYTGDTIIDDGILQANNGIGSATGTGTVTVANGGTLSGDGGIAGAVTVQSGGTLAPGNSAGILVVNNSLTFVNGSSLSIELGGTELGRFDRLEIDGVAMLDGTLNVELLPGFSPRAGDSFAFLVAQGGSSGMFDVPGLPELGPNLEWLINPGEVTISLLVNSTLEGDFDNDADVDLDDLTLWQIGLGTAGSAGRSDGDADGDFDSDGADFLIWQRQFGGGIEATSPASASQTGASAVPEPPTLAFILEMFIFGVFTRRCRMTASV